MAVTLSFSIEGEEEVRAAFAELRRFASDLSPAMADVASYLESSTLRRFELERDPEGSPWPPSLRARFQGGQTLTDTGRLRGSITSRFGPDFAEVGTNLIYAAVHQMGATIKPRSARALRFEIPGLGFRQAQQVTIPARPFLGVDDDDRGAILDIAAEWIVRASGGAAERA